MSDAVSQAMKDLESGKRYHLLEVVRCIVFEVLIEGKASIYCANSPIAQDILREQGGIRVEARNAFNVSTAGAFYNKIYLADTPLELAKSSRKTLIESALSNLTIEQAEALKEHFRGNQTIVTEEPSKTPKKKKVKSAPPSSTPSSDGQPTVSDTQP